jgi:Flp pilus assembly protein TadG
MSQVSGFPGEGGQLRGHHPGEGSSHTLSRRAASFRRLRGGERGQATVEFALVLLPLLTIVAGIIYFGIGLNYWLDMNRVANQGARWAVVDNWPAICVRTETSCTSSNSSTPCATVLASGSRAKLQDVLRCSARNNPAVSICYPGVAPASATVGTPVQVKLTAPYKFFFVDSLRITLTAKATMRMEQVPKLQSGVTGPAC